jgi:heavy metal sensor kinase
MFLKSIRFKIVSWYTVILILVLSLFSALVYINLYKTLNDDLNDMLQLKAEGVAESIDTYWEIEKNEGMATGAEKEVFRKINNLNFNKIAERWVEEQSDDPELLGIIVCIFGPQGDKIASSKNLSGLSLSRKGSLKEALLGHNSFETREFRISPNSNAELMRVFTMPVIEDKALAYIVQVARPMTIFQDALHELRFNFIVLLPLTALFSIIAGFLLANMIIRPLRDIVSTVRRITAENLKLRIKTPETKDEIQELADTFNSMLEKLSESFLSQRQLIQDVSHELRTPLTIMRGEMDVALKKTRPTEEYIDVLKSCVEEISHLSILVENLLILSRYDSREVTMDMKAFPVMRLINNIISDIHILADEKRILIECSGSDKIIVNGDERHLRRAFLNIIDNAIKYTNGGGNISIDVGSFDNKSLIKISDNGIGIVPESLPFIFNRFFRGDKSRSTEGYGLGLSISKSIIEAHGGSISINSLPGKGTTVMIRLPN